jgi:MFS family permease
MFDQSSDGSATDTTDTQSTNHVRTGPEAASTTGDLSGTNDPGRVRRFDAWRRDRPFLGGVLLLLSGLLIAYVPLQFATELLLVGGSLTFIGLLFAVLVFLSGVFALMRPEFSREIGIFGVAMAVLSIFGALGGLVVGMLIGVLGGNLCIAWQSPPDEQDSSGQGFVTSIISVVR